MENYSLAVIGSGSGNIVIDAAIKKGVKCALIEKGKFGGTCLNHGCIPTKVLTTVADDIRKLQRMSEIGIQVGNYKVDFEKIRSRVLSKIAENEGVKQHYDEQENVDVYQAEAKFVSDNEIALHFEDGSVKNITADKIVIAAGAKTRVPDVEGLEEVGYLTSESFFADKFPDKLYDSLIIVGGGYIGMEFAHIFSSLGTKVTVLQRGSKVMPRSDEDISKAAYMAFSALGIEILTNCDFFKVEKSNGKKVAHYKDKISGDILKVVADEILVSTGIMSAAEEFGIKNTSVKSDDRGYIMTNELLQTTAKNIYALGDANGVFQFKHKANYEAETIAHNMFEVENGNYRFVSYDAVPNATFTYPQIASVGMTEKEAIQNGYKIKTAKNHYSQTAKGYALGYKANTVFDGFAKIIVDDATQKILGVHIMGDEAALLLQPYVELMNAGVKHIRAINDDITSPLADKLRASNHTIEYEPGTLQSTDNIMVSHPSLAEVSMWTRYMDFKDSEEKIK